MAGAPVLERLTASDLFLAMWDDYGRSSDIGGLAICDGTRLLDPDGGIRIGAVRTLREPRLNLVPTCSYRHTAWLRHRTSCRAPGLSTLSAGDADIHPKNDDV